MEVYTQATIIVSGGLGLCRRWINKAANGDGASFNVSLTRFKPDQALVAPMRRGVLHIALTGALAMIGQQARAPLPQAIQSAFGPKAFAAIPLAKNRT